MQKSAQAFRTISEVADLLDVPAHVLRFWESRFTQISPLKRGGGRRYYRPSDVDLLRGIQHLLYEDGLTIKGAQKILKSKGVKHVSNMVPEPLADTPPDKPVDKPSDTPSDLAAIISQLQQLKASIEATL